MSPSQIVERLQNYVHACNTAAAACEAEYVDAIREHAVTVLSAADLIVQLQQRLVRQAMYFETIEAVNEPRWPLLSEDDDDPGMGL
jgi:hypothetical protein